MVKIKHFQQQVRVNNIKGCTEIYTVQLPQSSYYQFLSTNHQSFVSVQYMLGALLYKHAESLNLFTEK